MFNKELKEISSIPYYDKNAELFYQRTINSDMSEYYKVFLANLGKPDAKILDMGCGVGRDTHHFESLGYVVTAIDGSQEMVKLANKITVNPAYLMLFKDMLFDNEFDGIWAAASLIHVPKCELKDVINRVHTALKRDGIFFSTYKHGAGEYTQEERTFFYMTEESIRAHLSEGFKIIDIWKTRDNTSKIAHSPDQTWLNVIARRE